MIATDTNILIYAHRGELPQHVAAKAAVEWLVNRNDPWLVPVFAVSEFWCAVTNPNYFKTPSSPGAARRFISELCAWGACICHPEHDFAGRLVELAEALHVRGGDFFDLQIALSARDAGATTLWTHDRGFQTISGLARFDPITNQPPGKQP